MLILVKLKKCFVAQNFSGERKSKAGHHRKSAGQEHISMVACCYLLMATEVSQHEVCGSWL